MELNPIKWIRRDAQSTRRRFMGNVANVTSGLGGSNDKNTGVEWRATSLINREFVDRLYTESWFIRDLVNIPVDDMFILWREFEGDSADVMKEAELEFNVKTILSEAMKSGRKYGTGLVPIVSVEDDLTTELDINRIKPGDLRHLGVLDRFDVVQVIRDPDFASKTFNQPLLYRLKVNDYEILDIHASRVLRFDGGPVSRSVIYSRDWGTSVVIPAIAAANQDATIAAAIGHLVQETSSVTLKIEDLNDQVADFGYDRSGDTSPSIRERVASFNQMKSVFNTNVVDTKDSVERTNVNWSSLPGMLGEIYKRMSAISNIPATRLMGQSPVGMNATGESDMINYAMTVGAMQNNVLSEPLEILDAILAKNAGIAGPPEYKFLSLTEVSEESKAGIASAWASAVSTMVGSFIIDEDEARDILKETQLFGDLDGPAPEQPEPQTAPDDETVPETEDEEDAA